MNIKCNMKWKKRDKKKYKWVKVNTWSKESNDKSDLFVSWQDQVRNEFVFVSRVHEYSDRNIEVIVRISSHVWIKYLYIYMRFVTVLVQNNRNSWKIRADVEWFFWIRRMKIKPRQWIQLQGYNVFTHYVTKDL